MERWIGKIALVTGANAGIGEAITCALVSVGLEVVGLDKDIDHLEKLANTLKNTKGTLHVMKCNLRSEQEILKVFEWTTRELGGVDVLVNNAAVVCPVHISEGNTDDFKHLLDVNLLAAAICTREAMKSMKSRDTEGHILYLNSMLGFNVLGTPFPKGMYPATKFGLRGLIETVRQEIAQAKDNIRITDIVPALVKTDIFSSAGSNNDIYDLLPCAKCSDIADSIVYALSVSPYVCVEEITITPIQRKS